MKILIIKTGSTFKSIHKKYGDFEDFIINQLDIPRDNVVTCAVYKENFIPNIENFSGVIITGSHSMVTDKEDWSTYAVNWLRDSSTKDIPILGICYGHQLIAEAFGGLVDYHPKGSEVGTVDVTLTAEGERDLLLGVLPKTFPAHVAHSQTALKPPLNASILAYNNFEPHHAFCINKCIWGVQFHPEFNADVSRMYIDYQKIDLIKNGYDFDKLYESVKDHDYGKLLLKRFLDICTSKVCI